MDARRVRFCGLLVAASFAVAACGGGGGGTSITVPTPGSSSTPTPTPTSTPTETLLCTSGGAQQSIVRSVVPEGVKRRMLQHAAHGYAAGLIEVIHSASTRPEYSSLSARVQHSEPLEKTSSAFDVVRVTPGTENAAMQRLRAQSGVQTVSRVAYRSTLSTTAALTNDPYFQGFTGANTPPLYEASTIPGQWDMHVICAANAWGYANANTTGTTHAAAAGGSASVKVAVIDTGAYLSHPELTGRVTYAETDINGVTSAGATDGDGHGTNVAGIIGAAANNSLGFAGVAYNTSLMIFKVFPDPPCTGGCTALSSDVVLAINHAMAQHVNVINLSLGGSSADPGEESAVASAIASGVVVVAAAGNESTTTLDYPAADPNVIAVGASGLDDSNPLNIAENVASYSNYNASSPTTWGLVAPGGNATSSSDADDLHWIENIYSASGSDADCAPDYGGGSSTADCRILIVGTSQATPHVAGAAALLLSLGANPSNIKSILCSTANGIPGPAGGCGRLNVYRAAAQVLGDASP